MINTRTNNKSKNQKSQSKPKKKGNVNTMNQSFKPRRTREVNINTNFSMFNRGRSGSDRGVLIEKTEPVGVIESQGLGAYHICASYPLNPGQSSTFPILSQEAKVYEKYMFEELEFFTVPLVSEYAIGGQQGQVALAINYNPALSPPASQTAALSLKPYDANLPCLPLKIRSTKPDLTQTTAMFVRTGGLPGNSDIKTYDVGNLYATCEGLYETPFNICRLFVKYKCRLFNRVVLQDQGPPKNMSCSFYQPEAGQIQNSVEIHQYMKFSQICNGANLKLSNQNRTLTVTGSGNYNIDVNCSWYRAHASSQFRDALCELRINGVAQTAHFLDTGFAIHNQDWPMCVKGSFFVCVELKEGDTIEVTMQSYHGSGGTSSDTEIGAFIRVTSV